MEFLLLLMAYLQKYVFRVKQKDVNVKVFKIYNMIRRMNEVKTLAKHSSCNCKCKFNGTTCNSNEKWNNNKCKFEYKKYRAFKKDCTWNSSTCFCENNR